MQRSPAQKGKRRTDHSASNIKELSTKIHIVVDNSNLFIGAQQGQGENGIQDFAIRINVGNLVKIIEKNKKAENIKTRIVGGSKPPPTSKVWDEWKKYNYNCILGNRTAENKEEFLDDMLHAQMGKLILKNKVIDKEKQHLILITGDGNDNNNRTSFPEMVTTAIEFGWTVDIWGWKACFSGKYKGIQQKYPQQFQINYLDTHRSSITFREKKNFVKEQQTNINKSSINCFSLLSAFLFVVLSCVIFYYLKIF